METLTPSSELHVVRSVIVRDSHVLLLRRRPTARNNPNLWEIPGGKVKPGESLEDAREREILAETSLVVAHISPPSEVYNYTFQDEEETKHYKVFGSLAIPLRGEPQLSREHVELGWADYQIALRSELVTTASRIALANYHDHIAA